VLNEVAPPSKKHERMIKHIKKRYAKDGELTDNEKSIAYATAWKDYNKDRNQKEKTIWERLDPDGYVMSDRKRRDADREKDRKVRNLKMRYGKRWEDFTDEAKAKKEKEKEILAKYKEKKEKGIPFYDKKGSGYIRDGRKIYVYKKR